MNRLVTETISEILPRGELARGEIDGMYQLLARHFEGITREQFENDLGEKNWVILLRRAEQLVGFSTMLSYESIFAGTPLRVIYSGDTIVAPSAWGTTALPRAWIAAVNQLRPALPLRYYWLLLTSGFRTYRFLPVFWREFHPRWDCPTPAHEQQLLAHLAGERFGSQHDATRGIVRFSRPQRLRAELNQIPEGRGEDPHVNFFAARNPRYAEGDELVCLTELSPENLTAAGRRMVAPAMQPALR